MKKSLLSMFAVAAGLLMATSCSTKQEDVKTDGEATVTFVAQVPSGVNSRAPQAKNDASYFGDGATATNLTYAVYKVDADGNWAVIDELCDNKTINMSTTVSLKLVNGNTYAVAFWADAPTEQGKKVIYSFDKTECKITADYSEATTSNESYDAFYAIKEFTVNGSSQETIELKRPFAQLNIGTADLDAATAAGYTVNAAGVKVTVANTLNLKDGKVSGEDVITFGQAKLPEDKTFPVADYSYLTMNYLLVSADKTSDNTVTISYDNEEVPERTFNNVPLQRNYRTNIYGNLLTSTTDFNVVIVPGFEKDDYNMEMVWDGETTKEPTVENNVYVISTPSEWAYLCISDQNYATKSIELAADLDFGGHELGSIQLNGNGLYVDGKGYTIRNMKLVGDNKCISNLGTYCASLFCSPQGSTKIQNLTVKNAQVVCEHKDMDPKNPKGHAAVIFADLEPNAKSVTLENVHVIAADVYGIQPVAGLIGRNGSVPVTITNCSVEDSYFHNVAMVDESGYVATLVGRTDKASTITIESATSTNNTIDAYWTNNRGEESIQELAPKGVVVENVTHSGNVVNKTKLADAIVSNTEGLLAALAAGKSEIELQAGTYTIDNNTGLGGAGKTIKLVGDGKETAILKFTGSTYQNSANLSLENLTITNNNASAGNYDYFFYRAAELNLTNCNINGVFKTTATKTVIDGCVFTNTVKSGLNGYPIWLYANELVIKNSEVTGVEKGILVYGDGAAVFNVTVENCKFHATNADDKAAIEMHTEHGISGNLTISDTKFTGFKTSVGAGAGLWNEVINEDNSSYGTMGTWTKRFNVTVDGVKVQSQEL